MKTKKIIFFVLMFLPLAAALISLRFLPDQIPAHYGFDGQVDRWGSKYETLLYPAVTILMGCFMLAMTRLAARQEEQGQNNEKVLRVAGILVLGLFNLLNGYSLYADFSKVENLNTAPVDLYQLEFGFLGVLMIVLGNIMPKLRMNSVAGLRTRWSMKNEETWKKCQRFGGISLIVGGVAILLSCIVLKGLACMAVAFGVCIVLLVTDIAATRKIAAHTP